MSVNGWLSWLKIRSLSQKYAGRRRKTVLLGGIYDWLLEDRCLLSGSPIPFPTKVPNQQPTASNINTVNQLSAVLYTGANANPYTKTITITNSAPVGGPTIYPFIEGENSHLGVGPTYQGTAAYDPYDPANQEYRGYIGYQVGSGANAMFYAGVQPQSSITITVPLAFWDSGRLNITTDGPDLFQTYTGNVPSGSLNPNPTGAPFYFLDQDTAAIFFGTVTAGSSQLNFAPVYNSFANNAPSLTNWKSPVALGLFKNGQQFIVNGPGVPTNDVGTVNSSTNSITLQTPAFTPPNPGPQQYTFTTIKPQNSPQPSISQTVRYVQTGFSLTTQGSQSTNGVVMWYHSLAALLPNNDAPFQLTEITFRGSFYDATINKGTAFRTLLGSDTKYDDAKKPAADYDVSYVDSINMPVAMEATDVAINQTTPPASAPFGWVGSSQSIAAFQSAIATFASTNQFLGGYFGTNGFPSYINVQQGNLKLPSGQNLFLASPFGTGAVSDIKYYQAFSDGTAINEQQNALTSGPSGPIKLSIGGDVNKPSSGTKLYLFTGTNGMNNVGALNYIASNLKTGNSYNWNIFYNGDKSLGQVASVFYENGQPAGVMLQNGFSVPPNAGNLVYDFKRVQSDYSGQSIAGLWYAWAQYYATKVPSTPMNNVQGTLTGNILKLNTAAPAGLVPGMAVTAGANGKALPPWCVVLAISPDRKTITLSTVAIGNTNNSFNFAKPDYSTGIAGSTNNGLTLPSLDFSKASAADQTKALAFAQTVYVVMSAWSASVNTSNPLNPPAWNQLLRNIIGGNLSTEYLPYQDSNHSVSTILTNMSKSALRGVPDFTNPQYGDPALWYPDPAIPIGNPKFNAYNLDPVVWFIHAKMGLSAYAFALDDDYGNVNAPGASNVGISVGGLNGLPNPIPFSQTEPWGVVTTTGTPQNGNMIGKLTNPTTPPGLKLQTGEVANMLTPYNTVEKTPGTLVNGPGVKMGTTVQTTNISPTPSNTTITLSQALSPSPSPAAYSFWGQLQFTGTVFGSGQAANQIIITSPVINGNTLAYTTLSKLGPLNNIQVTGEGIDPTKTVTMVVNGLSQNVQAGTTTVTLSANLNSNLIPQKGTFYAYTFGSVAQSPRTISNPPPVNSPAPVSSAPPPSAPSTFQGLVELAQDEFILTIDQVLALVERALGIGPDPALLDSIAGYQNAINANPVSDTPLGQGVSQLAQFEALSLLLGSPLFSGPGVS